MRVAITGTNRGIGLELTRQFAARGDAVHAAARHPDAAPELRELQTRHPDRIHLHRCDVTRDDDVERLGRELGDASLDVLINNAGIYGEWESLEKMSLAELTRAFEVNAVSPLRVTRALLPHLRRGKTRRIVHITSNMGSISDNSSGGAYAYRMSKAALNMAARSMALDLAPESFICIVVHPGWVMTDMGGPNALISPETCVNGILRLIDGLRPEQNGRFFDYTGSERAW